MLYANSAVPLYKQLYYQLRDAIVAGEYRVGTRLPSERQLAADHGISRLTARKALSLLRKEGYVEAYQGRGSYVAHGTSHTYDHLPLQGFAELMLRQGMTPSSKVISCEVVPVSGEVARLLQIAEYEKVIKIRRLRLANNIPVALHTAYLRHPLCDPILSVDLEKRSLYRSLEEHLGIKLAHVSESMRDILGQSKDLRYLRLTPPAAVTQVMRRTYDTEGRVIEYLEAIYRADQYHVGKPTITASESRRMQRPNADRADAGAMRTARHLGA